MKKKYFLSLVAMLLLTFLLTACGDLEKPKDNSDNGSAGDSSQAVNGSDNDSGAVANEESNANEESIPETVKADVNKMLYAMESLMLCNLVNNDEYDATDPYYFWSALYYAFVNHGDSSSLAEIVGSEMKAPSQLVQEFATGLYADYSDLLPLPEDLTYPIRYDDSWDAYFFEMASGEERTCEILDTKVNPDGSLKVTARLFDPATASTLCAFTFTMAVNPYADEVVDPAFPYTISAMVGVDAADFMTDSEVTQSGTFLSFADAHTVEALVNGATCAFQVSDEKIVAILKNFEEGTEFTFVTKTDSSTGCSSIIEVIGE